MAFDTLDEHEQGEAVRKWLGENGTSILVGIGLGLLLIFGFQQWRTRQVRHMAEASAQYEAYGVALDAKNNDGVANTLVKLQKDYGDSVYAVLASLRSAAAAVERNDEAAALAAAEWAHAHSKDDALKTLSALRLARLKLSGGKFDEAIALIDGAPKVGFQSQLAELRGDVLAAQGKRDEARAAFQAAIDALDAQSPNRGTLEMKRDDLVAASGKQSS
jgi:predicted negative regulator of RcsB-dependent stress response